MRKYGELRNIWDYLGGASGKDPPANAGDPFKFLNYQT